MDNKTRVTLATAVLALTLGACTHTRQISHSTFRPPEGNYRLIVMPPDITVSRLTAGGGLEPRTDWTNQGRENVLKALATQQAARGVDITIAATPEEMGGDTSAVADLISLHKAVGQSIKMHKYSTIALPAKKDKFDWTLGNSAVEYGAATRYDYALFLHVEDSFSSSGRVALQAASILVCAIGICTWEPAGGRQAAFASLVDLKTGNVVWFNVLASPVGDIRTPEGADTIVKSLLGDIKPGESVSAAEKI